MALLVPKRVKYRKQFKGTRGGIATRINAITFGSFGLRSEEAAWVTSRQIEAARRAMTGYTQRGGRIWIRVFPDKSYTRHPAEATMGAGKGEVEGYVAVVKPGTILFEMGAVSESIAREAMRLAAHKLPIKTKFITRETQYGA